LQRVARGKARRENDAGPRDMSSCGKGGQVLFRIARAKKRGGKSGVCGLLGRGGPLTLGKGRPQLPKKTDVRAAEKHHGICKKNIGAEAAATWLENELGNVSVLEEPTSRHPRNLTNHSFKTGSNQIKEKCRVRGARRA